MKRVGDGREESGWGGGEIGRDENCGLLLCPRPLLLVLPTMLSATHHWCGHTTHGSCTWPSTSLHKACAYTDTHTHCLVV